MKIAKQCGDWKDTFEGEFVREPKDPPGASREWSSLNRFDNDQLSNQ